MKHPNAPMVLNEPVRANVSVEWPVGSGELIEYGVVTLEPGQTVVWHDWASE